MLMFLGFIVLIACLVIGVRRGGIGLATISGIGLVFFIFVMGLKPGKPPVDVMLTIMAVVTCSAFLQASKGLDVMLKYAEKFLRSNPKYITILAPLTTWLLAVLCGTGHVVYAMFPIIYDIAIKQNIRPERPMSVASIASQMGVCASPASVAVVSVVAILGATYHPAQKCLSGSISFSSGYRCDCYLWQLPTIIAALSQRQRRFEAVFHDTDNPADDAFYCRCHYDPVQC